MKVSILSLSCVCSRLSRVHLAMCVVKVKIVFLCVRYTVFIGVMIVEEPFALYNIYHTFKHMYVKKRLCRSFLSNFVIALWYLPLQFFPA